MTPPVALTIAAHDPLGGAGLAADLTTFSALGVHGMVAVTAVSAQRFGAVDRVEPVDADLLAAQLDGIIASTRISALKVGLVASADHVAVIADRLQAGALPAPVVDPVMVDGRGQRFVADAVEVALRERLFPLAAVVTPNRAEAELLLGRSVADDDVDALRELSGLGAQLVVVTGGRAGGVDVIIEPDRSSVSLPADWIDTHNVRGSGCTFAAAVTAGLALGVEPLAAVRDARAFVAQRLRDGASWTIATAPQAGPVAHVAAGPAG